MSNTLVKTFRAMTTTVLIVGSVFVQHVARAQQSESKHAGLQVHSSIGGELARYIIESGKPLFSLVR
jgi:hypothetical protein